MWVSHEKKAFVLLSNFIESVSWFIRAIVVYKGFEPIMVDQQLDFIKEDIPDLKLRYFT